MDDASLGVFEKDMDRVVSKMSLTAASSAHSFASAVISNMIINLVIRARSHRGNLCEMSQQPLGWGRLFSDSLWSVLDWEGAPAIQQTVLLVQTQRTWPVNPSGGCGCD
eukprot:c9890_g1_i1.p1 GENE.c9890_g1_i1~~c9890_g1_i1.p1  ORF type:complete len:109 (-),score=28.31 c9890_g1_i1:167-493(-)